MLRNLTLILLLLCLFSCKQRECSSPIIEIKMINKAEHSYGGKNSLTITNKEKIKSIESLLKKLKSMFLTKLQRKRISDLQKFYIQQLTVKTLNILISSLLKTMEIQFTIIRMITMIMNISRMMKLFYMLKQKC